MEASSLEHLGHYFTDDNRKKLLLKAGGRQKEKQNKTISKYRHRSQEADILMEGLTDRVVSCWVALGWPGTCCKTVSTWTCFPSAGCRLVSTRLV